MDCMLDEQNVCIRCGYRARRANTRRRCPRAPSVFERITEYGKSLARWIAAGRPTRTEPQIVNLLGSYCNANPPCRHYVNGMCSACGCRVNADPRGWLNKLAMGTEECPEGLWGIPPAETYGKTRVGFVLPVLACGGVEQWHISLIRAWRAGNRALEATIAFTGDVAVLHQQTVSDLADLAPIVGAVAHPRVLRVSNATEAIAVVGRTSDVLVVWSVSGPTLDACRATELPLVGVSHGGSDWWMSAAAPHVDSWVAVSEAARPPIPSPDATVIDNGIDVERCRPTLSREAVRDAAGIPRDARLIVSVGRLSPEKRLHLLAGALDRLPPDCWLWLVGDGREAERCREAAGRAADRLAVSPARRDVGNVLSAADCFAFVSQAEGYGLAPVEALAAGVPLASTPVGILPRLGDCAEWIPRDPTLGQVADAILVALRPNRCRVEASQALVLAEHSAEAMANRWAAYLTEVCHARPAPSSPAR